MSAAAKKVLLLVEGTRLSRDSLLCAVSLCRRTSASLLVLNTVPCSPRHTYWVDVRRRLERELTDEAARHIDPLLEEARRQGIEVECRRQVGEAEGLLADLAAQEGTMLAVVAGETEPAHVRAASPAAHPVQRLFQRIQTLFGCPLVAVKARK